MQTQKAPHKGRVQVEQLALLRAEQRQVDPNSKRDIARPWDPADQRRVWREGRLVAPAGRRPQPTAGPPAALEVPCLPPLKAGPGGDGPALPRPSSGSVPCLLS